MKKYAILVTAFALTNLMTVNALAGSPDSITPASSSDAVIPNQPWTWFATVSAGPVWADVDSTQTLYLTPYIEKTYTTDESDNVLASGELFAGIQNPLSPQVLGQFGVAVAATSNEKLQGMIWDDANANFANHSYQYKVQDTRVVAKGKFLLVQNCWLTPWMSASLGVGFNKAHDFSNTPVIDEALPNNNFTDHTETAFTYSLGVGVQKDLNPHWQVGVGYEFTDWGSSHLGRATDQTINSGLALDHLYTNGIMFNLTYAG